MTTEIRAVLLKVGMPPRTVEALPASLWATLGGVPDRFTGFALTRFGRRVADVWCREVAAAESNRIVFTPMFLYRQFCGEISGPILITVCDRRSGATLSMSEDEAATSIVFASRWPMVNRVDVAASRERAHKSAVRKVRR